MNCSRDLTGNAPNNPYEQKIRAIISRLKESLHDVFQELLQRFIHEIPYGFISRTFSKIDPGISQRILSGIYPVFFSKYNSTNSSRNYSMNKSKITFFHSYKDFSKNAFNTSFKISFQNFSKNCYQDFSRLLPIFFYKISSTNSSKDFYCNCKHYNDS